MRSAVAFCGLLPITLAAGIGPSDPTVVTSEYGARQPQAAIDDGRIHVVFGKGEEVRYTASSDGGRSYETPKTIGTVETLALGMRRGPRIAVADGSIVVSAIGHKGGDLFAWRSDDAGGTWTGPSRINTVPGSAREGLHAMAGRVDGTIFCAWLDLRGEGTQIYGSRSVDGGRTWDPDRLVFRSPDRTVCECCHPSAAFAPDGTLYVMWRNHIGGARDLYLSTSTDDGESFGPAQKLGEGTWPLNACPMDGGAVAAGPGGEVVTVWRRDDAVFVARPGKAERRLGRGQQPWAAWGTNGLAAAWIGPGGEGQTDALWMKAADQDEARILAEEAGSPVMVAPVSGEGPPLLLWESPRGIMALRVSGGPGQGG